MQITKDYPLLRTVVRRRYCNRSNLQMTFKITGRNPCAGMDDSKYQKNEIFYANFHHAFSCTFGYVIILCEGEEILGIHGPSCRAHVTN